MLKRPLLFFTCIYVTGILFGQFFNRTTFVLGLVLALTCGLLFLQDKQKVYLVISLVVSIFLFGAFFSYARSNQSSLPLEQFSGSNVFFEAQVVSQPDIREGKTNYTVVVKQVVQRKLSKEMKVKALLSVYNPIPVQNIYHYGSIIKGNGKFSPPSPARNPGAFDYKRFLSSQNIYFTAITTQSDITCTGQAALNPFIRLSLFLRDKIINTIDATLPLDQAGLLKGIVIGERNGLSENIENDFNISGLTHILCVSGANIAYIAYSSIFFLSLLKIKPPYSNLITIIVLISFTYITGSSPSVVRAAIMGIMLLAGEVFKRKSDVLTSISAASLIILLYNPLTLYDVGFQLSFAGTIGIVLFYKSLINYLRFLPKLISEVLSVSLAAQLTVNPLIALYFNKVSLIAIFSNLLVVPITGVVTILGLITSIAGMFFILPAKLISGLTFFFLTFMLWISKISAKIPYATISVITPSLLFITSYYIALYILLWYIPVRKPKPHFYKAFYASIIVLIISSLIMFAIPKPLKIVFVDIGQGDCSFIKTPSGRTCLIDGGGAFPGTTSSFDPGKTLIPFILDNGVASVDLAILSHAHGDHIQGLIKVVETLSVKKLIIGPQFERNIDLDNLLKLCKTKKVEIMQVSSGASIDLDGMQLKFLHPLTTNQFNENSSLNNNSLVFKLTYKNIKLLFAGDIQSDAEQQLLDSKVDLSADILKVPHHGSPSSSSINFLKAVSPSVCIISVGKNNFGHPSPVVIDRIKSVKSQLFRTDKNGGISFEIYKDTFKATPTIKY